jgi:Putative translation initiation inhibitor, yjgF family
VTAFLTDAALAADFNAVYAECFPEAPPARSTVVSGLLIPGGLVEIEAIAALPQ